MHKPSLPVLVYVGAIECLMVAIEFLEGVLAKVRTWLSALRRVDPRYKNEDLRPWWETYDA